MNRHRIAVRVRTADGFESVIETSCFDRLDMWYALASMLARTEEERGCNVTEIFVMENHDMNHELLPDTVP